MADGSIEVPDVFIRCVLGSISLRTLSHLTVELSDGSQATWATWDALDVRSVQS